MDPIAVQKTAAARLSTARQNPGRLSLIYAAGAFGLSLVVTLINFLLAQQLEGTGGLAGIGTRSMLSTAQSALTLLAIVLIPFWDAGYRHTCLCHAREQYTDPSNLLEGFRRWGAILRLNLLKLLLMTLISVLCMQAAGMLFMLSPFSDAAMMALSSIDPSDTAAVEGMVETIFPLMIPMYVIFCIVLLAVLIPVSYRIRLADLMVLDGENRALHALRESNRAMRGNCVRYFLLDLRFWWFFVGQLLATALSYGDKALLALGVNADPMVLYFVFFAVSVGLQFFLTWRFAPLVHTSYALAYNALKPQKPMDNGQWTMDN